MTIEELLDYPTANLAQLTDAQLIEVLHPYFPITRPASIPSVSETSGMAPELAARLAELQAKPSMLKSILKR